MNNLMIVVMLFLISACSSTRIRYDADVKICDQRIRYTYTKSYSNGAWPIICGVTSWYLGGACWFYLAMPTVPQRALIKSDGLSNLHSLAEKRPFEIENESIMRESWSREPASSNLQKISCANN